MQTGENEQALRKIIDFTRFLSIVVLLIHFYLLGYAAFAEWHLTGKVFDHIMLPVSRFPIFHSILYVKATVMLLMIVSVIGSRGKKDTKIQPRNIVVYALFGLSLFFGSAIILSIITTQAVKIIFYSTITMAGYFMILSAGSWIFRLIKMNLRDDIFNRQNESFPQEERLLENEYSVNLPATYCYQGKQRNSYINIINPFRGTLILGNPGSGKSYFVMRHIITQHIKKGFAMLLYDFKYPDLSTIAYNALLKYHSSYKVVPKFFVINLEKVMHRCNPLEPETMFDITDAVEASRTIMLGLNREWIKKQGDFFVESPINFVTALFWFLRKYEDGKFCTVPHAIELSLLEYEDLFSVLASEPEIEVLINPFVSAWKNEAFDQLEGQIASAKISLARLSSPLIYYVLSGSDFSLDVNNPADPKILCLANNPLKSQTFGPIISLINNRVQKLANRMGQQKICLAYDEFATLYASGTENLLATGRSNLVATFMALQDFSQLKKDYGRDQAEVMMNIPGNIICGQVTGDTAKQLSERFGKINQQKESISINSSDTSINQSTQLDYAVPASKIASLSSGEFVGMVADDPQNKIELKVFHNEILNDHKALAEEEAAFQSIPPIRDVDNDTITTNYEMIRQDIKNIIYSLNA